MELAKGRVQFADFGTGGKEYQGSTTTELVANFITLKNNWKCVIRQHFATHLAASKLR
jgi:hypothetical protein